MPSPKDPAWPRTPKGVMSEWRQVNEASRHFPRSAVNLTASPPTGYFARNARSTASTDNKRGLGHRAFRMARRNRNRL